MKFFFYGTLMHNLRNGLKEELINNLKIVSAAKVKGDLYAIENSNGFYPAFVENPKSNSWVSGILYKSNDDFTSADLNDLDKYEEYFPDRIEQSEYMRKNIPILLKDGDTQTAMMYVYNKEVSDLMKIKNGDFFNYVKLNELQTYSK